MFKQLSEHNWHVKSKKCVLFLGHIIMKDGISVADIKVSSSHNWPVPKNLQNTQEFLGLFNFYQCLIRSFAKMADLLTSLTKK